MKQYIYFKDLPQKAEFIYNGNLCIKKSSRTMIFIGYVRWFYAGQRDLCVVGKYCSFE